MEANLNAIAMLLLAGGTGVACAALCKQRPSLRRVVLSLLGGAVVALGGFTLFMHSCREGQPVMQAAVCAACLAAIWIFVTGGLARATGTVTLLAACIALCAQYNDLVHRPGYTGEAAPAVAPADARPSGEIRHRAPWHSRLTRIYEVDSSNPGGAPATK